MVPENQFFAHVLKEEIDFLRNFQGRGKQENQ
jgi:hypothetical protein